MTKEPSNIFNNVLLIGAGGVASCLLPVFLKTFRPKFLTIYDKDRLEERNLDRQFFNPRLIGMHKGMAMIATLELSGFREITEMTAIPEWFTEHTFIDEFAHDLIICAADNHTARRAALALADEYQVPCIVTGNEYFDYQAMLYLPADKGTQADPRVRYDLSSDAGSPTNCTGAAQQASPQLAVANFCAAAAAMHLLWQHAEIKSIPSETSPLADYWWSNQLIEIYGSSQQINLTVRQPDTHGNQ